MKFFYQWRRYLPLFLLTLFFVLSCEKADTGTTTDQLEYDRWDQIDMSNVVYEQMNSNIVDLNPFDLLPERMRDRFETEFTREYEDLMSLEYNEVLSNLEERGHISKDYAEAMDGAFTEIGRSIPTSNLIDFDLILNTVNSESNKVKFNFNLNLDERKRAVASISIVSGVFNYFKEFYPNATTTQFGAPQFRSCTFGERLRCIFFGTVIGIGAGATVGAIIGSEIADEGGALIGGVIGGYVGGFVGLLGGLFNRSICCEPDLECYTIEGVNLRFNDCTAAATYIAFGFGDDDVELNWENDGGSPVEATTPTANPRLLITQEANAPFVETNITSVCSDGTTNALTRPVRRDLDQLSRDVSGVFLIGPDQIYPGETYNYTGLGINSRPGSYTVQWFVNGGTVVSTTNSEALVQWNEGITNGWVQMQVYNTCNGGISKVLTLNVTGDGPIP